jgi:hypothetical protein
MPDPFGYKRFDSFDPRRVMEITFEVARLPGKPLTETQDTEESSRPERRRPRRHQNLRARQVWQLRNSAKKCVNTRDPFNEQHHPSGLKGAWHCQHS